MVLTERQRLFFAEYCRRQSESAKAIADELEKLGPNPVHEALIKQEKLKSACYAFVCNDLGKTTTVEVSPGDTGNLDDVL